MAPSLHRACETTLIMKNQIRYVIQSEKLTKVELEIIRESAIEDSKKR